VDRKIFLKPMQNIFPGKSSGLLFGLFLSLLAFNSCKKADTIGLEVLPVDDRLQGEHTDTITVLAHIMLEDSLSTTGTTIHVLGSHNDPVFGFSKASIYTQLNLSAANPDFGANAIVDSVVLSLAYAGHYADIMKLGGEQSFSVHRLLENLVDSPDYYSDDSLNYLKFPLGTFTGLIDTRDSVSINGVNQAPQMRIRLKDSFGTELLNSASLTSDESFQADFKGFYITPTQNLMTGAGSLLYINPGSAYTKMTLYYHNDSASGLPFDFVMKTSTVRFNQFAHDYSDAFDITAQLADSSLGSQKLYLQSMAGLKAKITFPHLNKLLANGQQIAINKAELIFPVADNTTERLSPPSRMALVKKGSDGKDKVLDDNIYESADFAGGYYNSSKDEFAFNIPRHIQGLLKDTTADKSIYLRVAGSAVSGNRVIINGTQNPDKPLKLRLTYTILE
jgi:hypothetical protein